MFPQFAVGGVSITGLPPAAWEEAVDEHGVEVAFTTGTAGPQGAGYCFSPVRVKAELAHDLSHEAQACVYPEWGDPGGIRAWRIWVLGFVLEEAVQFHEEIAEQVNAAGLVEWPLQL